GPLAFPRDVQRALELALREARHRRAREIAPGAPVCRRIDDDRHAGLGQRAGHEDQRAVDDLALGVGVAGVRREHLADRVELQQPDGHALLGQPARHRPRDGGLAAAGHAGDPDRPAHRAAPQSRGTSARSNRWLATSDVARWTRSMRSWAGRSGYHRGCASTSARKARNGGSTCRMSWSWLASMYVVRKSPNSVANGSATPRWPCRAA